MSTYALYGEIVFPEHHGRQGFKIRRFSDVKIESSWQSLTGTAEITIPRRVKDFDRMNVTEWFREGDPVEIYLGYDGNLVSEFTGYLAKVRVGIPLVLSLEDEMYQLKRKTVSVSYQNATLKQLLNAIAPGYKVVCDETILGSVRFSNMAASAILDELKKNGIHSWFVGKELHAMNATRSDIAPVNILLERTAGESLKQKAIEETLVVIVCYERLAKN